MKKRKHQKRAVEGEHYQQKLTQNASATILSEVVRRINEREDRIIWTLRPEEDQEDVGIDFECRLTDRKTDEVLFHFKIQNKGSRDELVPLTTSEYKGMISYPLKLKKAKFYRQQLNLPLLYTVVDTEKDIVYWHPIQLDDTIDEKIENAKRKKTNSIQIHIDPTNKLNPDTFQRFVNDVKESYDTQIPRFNYYASLNLFGSSEKISIDKSKHLLDQTFQAVNSYFGEFSIIPPGELLRLYPFSTDEKAFGSYESFTATVANEELFDLLKKMSDPTNITDKDIRAIHNHVEKGNKIVDVLIRNGIQYVRSRKSHDRIALTSSQTRKDCNCARCEYERFSFLKSIKEASKDDDSDSVDELFKKAYYQYQLGNYVNSYTTFKKAVKKAKKQKKQVFYYLGIIDLRSLRQFLQFSYDHPKQQEILKSDDKSWIEQELTLLQSKKFFGAKLLKNIAESKFYSEHFVAIANTVQKIETHYYRQLNGGWSSNNDAYNLIAELYLQGSFLNYNFIIFDKYNNYVQVMDLLVKGVICSHAMFDHQTSRLHAFNSYLIKQLILYANADKMIEYANRYSLSKITYVSDANEIQTDIANLIDTCCSIRSDKEGIETGNYEISRFLDKIFSNALVLLAYLDLPEINIKQLTERVVRLQSECKFMSPMAVKYLKFLLTKRPQLLAPDTIKDLLFLTIKQSIFHDPIFVDVLTDIIRQHYSSILLAEQDIQEVLDIYSGICPLCNVEHPRDAILYYYFVSDERSREIIKIFTISALDQKFDFYLYYSGVLFGIIEYELHFEQFVNYVHAKKENKSFAGLLTSHELMFSHVVDNLVNLLYCTGHSLQDERFTDIKLYSRYYEWLFDPEQFDYSNFDPLWLLRHPTKFYWERFSKIQDLKKSVLQYLKISDNRALTEYYIEHLA